MSFAQGLLQQISDDDTPSARRTTAARAQTVPPPTTLDGFLASVELQAYHIARYALWDREAALDVVQDSMLRLVERYAQRPPTEWSALFFTIVRNRINDVRRTRQLHAGIARVVGFFRRDDDTDDAEPIEATVADPGNTPEQSLLERSTRAQIDDAMRALPERQRQVLILREWQELSVKETAQALGCSEGTVKQHHFRALAALRKTLAEIKS